MYISVQIISILTFNCRYVDEIDVDDAESRIAPPVFMCISEGMLGGMGVDDRVSVSMVAVTPSTGDVIWDDFEDGFMRNELEVSNFSQVHISA